MLISTINGPSSWIWTVEVLTGYWGVTWWNISFDIRTRAKYIENDVTIHYKKLTHKWYKSYMSKTSLETNFDGIEIEIELVGEPFGRTLFTLAKN
ncbi:hypothetical protein RUM43_001656 [Polyplax serrata]|uniref:Uncharacterized protein n=1 Tax=Polyplax serrata TaxID=468196 RepID=A0AAN8SJY3_POLSC